jgi:hypothetical protein
MVASSSRLLEGLELRPAGHGLPLAPLVRRNPKAPAHPLGLFRFLGWKFSASAGPESTGSANIFAQKRLPAAEIALYFK